MLLLTDSRGAASQFLCQGSDGDRMLVVSMATAPAVSCDAKVLRGEAQFGSNGEERRGDGGQNHRVCDPEGL